MVDDDALIDDFRTWLGQVGASIVLEQSSESFGDQLTIFALGALLVRVIRDRGIWRINIAGPHESVTGGGSFWFSLGVWQAYLDKVDPPTDAMPLDLEAAFVKDRQQDIEAAFRDDKDLDDNLRSIRKEGAEARRRLRDTQ